MPVRNGSPRRQAQPTARRASSTRSRRRQLTEAVRGLTEDRDRLITRLAAVEHSLGDITGAIAEQSEKATPPAAQGTSQTDNFKTANAPAANAPGADAPGADAPAANSAALPPPWPAGDLPEAGMASSTAAAAPVVPPFAGLPSQLPAIFDAPTPRQATSARTGAAEAAASRRRTPSTSAAPSPFRR